MVSKPWLKTFIFHKTEAAEKKHSRRHAADNNDDDDGSCRKNTHLVERSVWIFCMLKKYVNCDDFY